MPPITTQAQALGPTPRWPLLANRAAGLALILGCAAAGVTITFTWPGPVDTAWTLLIASCLAGWGTYILSIPTGLRGLGSAVHPA
ncbi:hypothetical protein Prum_069080 [Phytohabitans rumicis]|uniref:Uncharacterized protein n=2 Tax=Phytohabitans rumicis TaxID=1076125 RepID=A0A6V8LGM7_9ACTN|nr:hypothetical protein Prum_069080 [Phytohabitans rumicis]